MTFPPSIAAAIGTKQLDINLNAGRPLSVLPKN